MLFMKTPLTAEDVRAFCGRFSEGLRVEYKATFDDSVRRVLPKIVSSFANSRGGVLVLGVRAVNGIPQDPIEGFEPSTREEMPLTIENICIDNLVPTLPCLRPRDVPVQTPRTCRSRPASIRTAVQDLRLCCIRSQPS